MANGSLSTPQEPESQWRRYSNVVIVPEVEHIGWDSFESTHVLIEAGVRAAQAALPQIRRWLRSDVEQASGRPCLLPAGITLK